MAAVVVSIVAFVLGFLGSMPLAGPIAVMVVSRSAEKRYREARHLAYGAAVAEGFYALLAFWGFATFLARHAAILPFSHALTAAVLLGVGIHFVRWKGACENCDEDEERKSPFVLGISLAALNPTILLTWSVVTTALYSRQLVRMTGLMAVPFGLAAGAGVAAWFVLLVALLKRFANTFPKRAVTWTVRGMGMLLIAVAVWSGVDLARHVIGGAPLHQAEVKRPKDGPRAVADAELGEDVRDVVLDRPLGHEARLRDLAVGISRRHHAEDLDFAFGQSFGHRQSVEARAQALDSAKDPLGDDRIDDAPAVGHRAYRAGELLERHVLEEIAACSARDPAEDELVVVEGGQDDARRRRWLLGQCVQ
jgi:threonine/homoserine/homoserine lactone efflux protein